MATLRKWEFCRVQPFLRYLPAIFEFLDYNPFEDGRSLGELVRAKRLELGWSQDKLGEYFGVCGSTIGHWESGKRPITNDRRGQLMKFLSDRRVRRR